MGMFKDTGKWLSEDQAMMPLTQEYSKVIHQGIPVENDEAIFTYRTLYDMANSPEIDFSKIDAHNMAWAQSVDNDRKIAKNMVETILYDSLKVG